MNQVHLFLKFNNDELFVDGRHTNTINEHIKMIDKFGMLVWGQGSKKDNIIDKRKKKLLDDLVRMNIPVYIFFISSGKERRLFFGRYIASYVKGELSQRSPEVKFIPNYYSYKVGTPMDDEALLLKTDYFYEIDPRYVDEITLESNGKKVLAVNNSSSLFYVEISNKLNDVVEKIIMSHDIAIDTDILDESMMYSIDESDIKGRRVDLSKLDVPGGIPEHYSTRTGKKYKRNKEVLLNALIAAGFKCELDSSHMSFTSCKTKQMYVEAHHLIPMSYQGEYDTTLDRAANIISLCPNCHKKLHHAVFDEIKDDLKRVFKERKARLKKCNIEVDEVQILNYYK